MAPCDETACRYFNMQTKILDTSQTVMFASRFLISTNDGLCLMPDPVKRLFKTFRLDVKDKEHCHEIVRGMRDGFKMLRTEQELFDLVKAASLRHKADFDGLMEVFRKYLYII